MPPDRRLYGLIMGAVGFLILFITVEDLYGVVPMVPRDASREDTAVRTQAAARDSGRTELVEIYGEYYQMPEDIKLRNLSIEPPWMNRPLTIIQKEYQRLLSRLELECRRSARLGTFTDGGWHVCMAAPYNPTPPCLVYDFGIGLPEHSRTDKIHFYPVGLWSSDKHPKDVFPVKSFKSFLRQFGEENTTIDVLKIDIDGSEWVSLKTMLEDGSLTHVKQLAMELHASPMAPTSSMTVYVDVVERLLAAGFRLWRHDWNMKRIRYTKAMGIQTRCHELYFLNINFLK